MSPIRWGILGCGDVTEVKSGPALRRADGSDLVAVMRRDGAKAADYARRHGVPRWYEDADALIADADVDAVYVATPPSSHRALALKVAAAGKPCLVEKPMATNAAECQEMIDAFDRAGTKLFVAYYRRALPAFVRAKAIVDAGTLGQITAAACRFARPAHRSSAGWRTDPAISGGGLFVDLASHALNALEWIVGPFDHATGDATSSIGGDVEDLVTLQWRCGNGALGTAHYNFASAVSEDVLEITGTDARLTWACFGDGTLTLDRGDGRVEVEHHPPPRHVHGPLVQTIVDELRGNGRCPSDAASALRTQALIDAAIGSFYLPRRRGDAERAIR